MALSIVHRRALLPTSVVKIGATIRAMPDRSRKRPRDPNQLAKLIVDIATGEVEDTPEDTGKDPAAVALGRKGGLKGGKARAAKMTPEQRSESARRAAATRWQKD
ncbi:MAG: histone H1 [Solirubrobacteraceae bacterium]